MLLSKITRLQDEALQVNEKSYTSKDSIKTLVYNIQEIFINGPMALETMQNIIQKTLEMKQSTKNI